MTWFRVDDNLAFHAKVVAAGNTAMGLWVRAGSWSAQQLTDGHVPTHMVAALGGTKFVAGKLIAAGLWTVEDDGYCFHEWSLRQPSAAEIRANEAAKHEAKVEAGRLGGLSSAVARRKHNPSKNEADAKQTASTAEANAKQNEAPALPNPTQPLEVPAPTPSASLHLAGNGGPHTVIAAYVDAVHEAGAVLDKRAKGRIAKETPELLANGATVDLLCDAARRLAVNGYADLGAEARRLWAERNPRVPASTTDKRVAQGLALIQHFADQEGA